MTVVVYETRVRKALAKQLLPKNVLRTLHNALVAIDTSRDMNLFDVKELKGDYQRSYFRLRKGKYRAIFFIDSENLKVIYIGKREDVYKRWE